jgi:hypothetical protein
MLQFYFDCISDDSDTIEEWVDEEEENEDLPFGDKSTLEYGPSLTFVQQSPMHAAMLHSPNTKFVVNPIFQDGDEELGASPRGAPQLCPDFTDLHLCLLQPEDAGTKTRLSSNKILGFIRRHIVTMV